MKTIKLDGFGDILEFAESIGWIDSHGNASQGNWSPREADTCEADAIDYIETHGYKITQEGE